jgi:hypothetical protein
MQAAGVMKGTHPIGLPRRSRTYKGGRKCSHPGCTTRLSTYNRRETCFVHTGVRIPRLRGKKAS